MQTAGGFGPSPYYRVSHRSIRVELVLSGGMEEKLSLGLANRKKFGREYPPEEQSES